MNFKNEFLYGLFIKHFGEYFDKESKKLLDSEYIQRIKDKLLNVSHKNKYFHLKLVYTLCEYYETENKYGYFNSEILALQVFSSVFIGLIGLNDDELASVMKNNYDYRYYDKNYNYYVKLKTNKLKPNS